MDISKVDKNFDLTFTVPEDIQWFSIREQPFAIHGITYSEEEGQFRRLPKAPAPAAAPLHASDLLNELSKV